MRHAAWPENVRWSGWLGRFFLAGILAAGGQYAGAADPPAGQGKGPELKLRTERVIVFKDGYCLIVKRGSAVTDQRGEISTTEVPDAAVLGSFWATPREGRLIGMVAGWDEVTRTEDQQLPCLQAIEVLQANLGKKCSLQLPDNTTVTGIIQSVLTQETREPVPEPLREGLLRSSVPSRSSLRSARPAEPPGETAEYLTGISGTHFVLRTEQGDVLLSAAEIRRLTIDNMATTLPREVKTTQRTKRLTFRFEQPGQEHELLIAYFRPGLRWIPAYRIQLPEDPAQNKLADITLQAELINEAEDLIETPIDIVVGVPNFRFREVPSPLVLEQTLRNALQQAAPQLMGQFSNALMTQRAGEFRRDAGADAEAAGAVQLPPELTAAAAQELYVYHLPPSSLRKGQRAAMTLFTAQAPYRDVYTWEVRVQREDIATAPSGADVGSPLRLAENQVWRQLELSNTGDIPWTTGAAIILQGQQPLAQELLTYTSPKAACRVPVTVAIDVRGSFAEEETGRDLNALTWDGHAYAKIKQCGQLTLNSYKQQPIEAEIMLRFGGKAEEVSDGGTVALSPYRAEDWNQYRGSPAVNNGSTVRWKTTLQPGQAFRPTVKYHFYTRH